MNSPKKGKGKKSMELITQEVNRLPAGDITGIITYLARNAPQLADLSQKEIEIIAKEVMGRRLVKEMDTAVTIAGVDYGQEKKTFLDNVNSPHTQTAYAAALGRLESWTEREGISPLSLSYKQADDFIYFLKSESRAAASIRRDIAAVSAFMSWIERRYDGIKNTFRGTKSRPRQKAKKTADVPTAPEVEKIIQVSKPLIAAAISVMAFRGLRAGALPSLAMWGGRFTATSKGKDISGELPPRALKAIEAAGLSLKAPFAGQTVNSIEKAVRYLTEKLYKSGAIEAAYSCHDFRHFYAVTEYQKDKDIHRVKDLLHHSSIEITDNYLRSLGAL
jgi:site-specific recombinase XerD